MFYLEHIDFSLTSLLIVTILSFIIPILIKRIKRVQIPVVVGEIVAGMIIGKSGFDFIVMDENLNFIMFFGLAYLMFASGLEIDFQVLFDQDKNSSEAENKSFLQKYLKNPVVFSIIILLFTLAFAYIVSLFLAETGIIKDPLLMALIIGTTSLGVVVPILKEKGIAASSLGQYIITGAVMADFVTMLLISVAVSLFKGGFSAEVFLIFGLLFLVFVFYRISLHFQQLPLIQNLAHGTTQIGIRGSFALILIFLVLAESIGVELILGAFLAGTIVSLVSQNQREEIYHKLDAIGFGFLIPIFFILVGVTFDIKQLFNNPEALVFVPILLFIVYLVKGIPALLLKLFFPWRETMGGAILLTTQMSVTIAAAAVGLQVGAISPEVNAAIILVAILTSIISPILFGKIIPDRQEEKEEEKNVVIIGTTKEAVLLARRLISVGIHVMIIESKREKVEDYLMTGIEIAWGDATNKDLLEELEITQAQAVIIATGSDEKNHEIATLIAEEFAYEKGIALISDPNVIEKSREKNQFRVVNPNISVVSLLENMIRHPITADILEDKRDLHMEEVEVTSKKLIGKMLRHANISGEILIFSIYREGETLLPHGDTVFQKGDILLVLGTSQSVQNFQRYAAV